MGIIAFFSRPEALERTSNTSLTQVSQQWVTEEPPARPGPRAFPFLQPSAWATGTQRLLRPVHRTWFTVAAQRTAAPGPRTAPGLTAPSRAFSPSAPRSPHSLSRGRPGPPRTARPAPRPPRPGLPAHSAPGGGGRAEPERGGARRGAGPGGSRRDFLLCPRPAARRPAPLARSRGPGGRRPWISPSAAAMAAQCCCRKAPGAEAAPARPPPEPPPALDVASASSAQLFRLRHLQLGLELRPEARELAGCLVLELCARRPAPRALVLDAHPALRLHSAAFRRAPAAAAAAAAEPPCAFAFAAPGPGPAPPPPLPAFCEAPGAEPACCPLAFRVDPFTDYGSSLTVTLPPELQEHQPFQVILRYTSTDAPAVSPASGRPLSVLPGWGAFLGALRPRHLQRGPSPALREPAPESCPGAGGASQLVPGEPLGALDRVSPRVLVPGRGLCATREASPFSCAGPGPCLETGAASVEHMPSHTSARA